MSTLRVRNKVITQENVVDSTTEAMLAGSSLSNTKKTSNKRKGAAPTRERSSRVKKPSAAAVAAAQTEELAADIIINPKKVKSKPAVKKPVIAQPEVKASGAATSDVKKGRGKPKAIETTPEIVNNEEITENAEDVPPVVVAQPKKGRKQKAAAAPAPEEEKDEEEDVSPPKKSRGKPQAAKEVVDDEINEEEPEVEVQPQKNAKKRGGKKEKTPVVTEDVASVNGNGTAEVVEKNPKGKKPKKAAAAVSPTPIATTKLVIGDDDEGDDDGSVDIKQKDKKRTGTTSTGNGKVTEKDSKIAKNEKTANPAKRGARGKKVQEVDEENSEIKSIRKSKHKLELKADKNENDEEIDEPALKKAKKNIVIKEKISKVKPSVKKSPKTVKVNKSATDYEKIDFNINNDEWNLKISSWNVAGLRAWVQKGGNEYVEYEKPDIICLQETKCALDDVPEQGKLKGYHPYWLCNPGGYAGVAILSKIMPMNIQYGLGDAEHDAHGRCMTAEYEKFYLVCVYVPNSGRKLVSLPTRLKWNETFHKFIQKLDSKKPVILCGDMNVSHLEIDLANPKTNKRNAGFTQEERDGMTDLLSLGFIDTFRKLYPDRENAYTFWTYMMNARAKNVGWRLDYFIVSQRFASKVIDNVMRNDVYGSDHCPITLFLKV